MTTRSRHHCEATAQAANPATDRQPRPIAMLLCRAEVCAIFGIHERTLRRWEQRGLITAVRVGRTVRFRPDDMERLLGLGLGG